MAAEHQGIAYIVGAGPGDAGLLTVRGREVIDLADVIVYDALVNPDLLPATARTNGTPEVFPVGKRGERKAVPPEEVHRFIISLVRQGKRVVHLTGGDPFVFGRGSEEAQTMHEAQVPFEIVPGVTAGVAAAAYAGIPVTHRSLATSVTFVTGRDDPAKADTKTDWRALARVGGTIVVYNGLAMLPAIAAEMMAAGMPGEIPAAAIQGGTRSDQRTVVATLATLAREVELAGLGGAVTVVIGWSVILRDELAWFDRRPLFGRRIAVMPSPQSSAGFSERLRELGAEVIDIPAPRPARLDLTAVREDIEGVSGQYDWVVFASADAVAIFWEQLLMLGRDTRALAGVKILAVGAQTAASLLDHGVTVDLLQARFEAQALLDLLADRADLTGARVLYASDDEDEGVVPRGLAELGAAVTVRALYRSVQDEAGAVRIRRGLERGAVDLVAFPSSASVAQYVRAVGDDLATRAPAAAADESTADALRGAGIDVTVESAAPGPQALAEAIRRHFEDDRL